MLAGALIGAGAAVVSLSPGCLSAEERRAISLADCVAQLALDLPEGYLLEGIRACRRLHAAPLPEPVSPLFTADGGP